METTGFDINSGPDCKVSRDYDLVHPYLHRWTLLVPQKLKLVVQYRKTLLHSFATQQVPEQLRFTTPALHKW